MDALWIPSVSKKNQHIISKFSAFCEQALGKTFAHDHDLWAWSTENPLEFWQMFWTFAKIKGTLGTPNLEGQRFFTHAKLNFSENLLIKNDDTEAIVFWAEDKVKQRITWKQLHQKVAQLADQMKCLGIQPGDRVGAFIHNAPEAIIALLACASIGAIWSSCSPDFGEEGAFDRLGQIEPKLLIAVDGYFYHGKIIPTFYKIQNLRKRIASIEHTILIPFAEEHSGDASMSLWNEFLNQSKENTVTYTQFPFNHPLCILYSSGTTGKPKCIVHSAGGTLIQHMKEHQLHSNIHPNDRITWFSTCGWMMWNWLVSGLASGATLLLYDGSPQINHYKILWDFAQQEQCTLFGTSAKYLDALFKYGLHPKDHYDLPHLRTIGSTGSVLVAERFEQVYRWIKKDVHLASVSGGTDIISCFVLGYPNLPVWSGELQGFGLGMACDIFNDLGEPAAIGEKGELVCTKPFPSMPLGFWNDPTGEKYYQAYFSRFPNIWTHGDFAEKTKNGGIIIHGRSDAVLNPGGVRIGTAEIYRQVEAFPEIQECIAVGQKWLDDERIILFVKMTHGQVLSPDLIHQISQRIRQEASPRHVPQKIIQINDIPKTMNGKIVELAVKQAIHGEEIKNLNTLINPEALDDFRNIKELTT